MKDLLKGISKDNKRDFLAKLASKKFTLNKPYEPAQPLNFDLQEDGLYLCKEDGRKLTSQEIETLPGYRLAMELVSDRLQVSGEKPPDGYYLMPFTQEEYLNSLLKDEK
jgi:hypothetical protein